MSVSPRVRELREMSVSECEGSTKDLKMRELPQPLPLVVSMGEGSGLILKFPLLFFSFF